MLLLVHCFMMNACKTTYKPEPAKSSAAKVSLIPPDSLVKKQLTGVDFFAQGNDPVSWSLELDLETGIIFSPAGGLKLIAAPVPVTRSVSPAADSYLTRTDSGSMKLFIYDELCSATEKSRKVEVTINDKRYTGCGKYLYNYQLNNIWVLQYIDNKEPEQQDYKKLPRLEFDLTNNTMKGFDGCGNISSTIFINGNHIKFTSFAGSKPGCSDNGTAKIFSTMISDHTVDYKIENGRLSLYLINDSKLSFTKSE